MTSPAAILPSQAFCASDPAVFSTVAASTDEPMKGDGVRVRPRLSAMTPASTAPRPEPPSSSAMTTPEKPISPNARHRSRETPSGSRLSRNWRKWAMGACSFRKPSAAS